jgi:hypothetical protein
VVVFAINTWQPHQSNVPKLGGSSPGFAESEQHHVVRDAVEAKVRMHGDMKLHTITLSSCLQHMAWHEGYHHGQIKLALKLAGQPENDEEVGPLTWGIWMHKTEPGSNAG